MFQKQGCFTVLLYGKVLITSFIYLFCNVFVFLTAASALLDNHSQGVDADEDNNDNGSVAASCEETNNDKDSDENSGGCQCL